MDNGWIGIAEHPIAAGDAPVIVWHVYSGVMVERRDHAAANRFMTHWQEINAGAWIDAQERTPTKEDADEYDCVISQNQWGDIAMAGWHRFEHEKNLVRWQHPPSPPHNFRELRNKAK